MKKITGNSLRERIKYSGNMDLHRAVKSTGNGELKAK